MIDTVKLEGRTLILGAILSIGVKNVREATEANISGLTATVTIYDSAGSIILSATTMTISGGGTPYVQASYLLATGAGQIITTVGSYRAIYTLTYGTTVLPIEQAIQVLANPF